MYLEKAGGEIKEGERVVLEIGDYTVVQDPCYDKEGARNGRLGKVLTTEPGKWKAFPVYLDAGNWGNRVKELIAFHSSKGDPDGNFVDSGANLGVDSGQMCICDASLYPEEPGEFDEGGGFYDKACHITLGKGQFGVFDKKCAVSSSGFGDGVYPLFVQTNSRGQVVAIKVMFIGIEGIDGTVDEEEDE